MVNHKNESEYGHILTVEDPIEFVHESKKCLINQREVGPHTLSFNNALRSALREDPDVILVGEMRDLETIRLAMSGAETGHLVFGTLHTSFRGEDHRPHHRRVPRRGKGNDPRHAVRIIEGGDFADPVQDQGRQGPRRRARNHDRHPAIRNLIREAKVAQMYSAIQTGNTFGMQTLDQNLTDLVKLQALWARDPHMKRLDRAAMDQLMHFFDFATVVADRELMRQDEYGSFMIVLLSGTMAVDRDQQWGERVRLSEARPGEILGEMSLLDSGKRFSHCITLTECEVAILGAEALDEMMTVRPQLAASLIALLARKMSLRLRAVGARMTERR
jgi:CRP-like cAMP-binding protein